MMREDREDYTAQEDALTSARENLARALSDLEAEARTCARTARTKRGIPDLPAVYAAVRAVQRAEETVDLAALDLHTARGGDA